MDRSEGRVALVTGGARGIGRAVSGELTRAGVTVVVGVRDVARGRAMAGALVEAGGPGIAVPVRMDVTDDESVAAAAAEVEERFGRIDVLVNNAGVLTEARVPSATPALVLRHEYATNVFGVVAVTHAFLPLLRRSEDARVINLSSQAGSLTRMSDPTHRASSSGLLAYNSSKAAVNALTVVYANELRDEGITVVAVCPGYVPTDLSGHRGTDSVDVAARFIAGLATGARPASGSFLGTEGSLPW